MTKELKPEVYERLKALRQEGDVCAGKGEFNNAISKFEQALDLIPEPLESWEASLWVLGALGDMYVSKHDYVSAIRVLNTAMHCGGIGNSFLHLRLGQAQFELGNEKRAGDELARAFMGGGQKIFDGEDPRYFDFVKRILKEPPEGWGDNPTMGNDTSPPSPEPSTP